MERGDVFLIDIRIIARRRSEGRSRGQLKRRTRESEDTSYRSRRKTREVADCCGWRKQRSRVLLISSSLRQNTIDFLNPDARRLSHTLPNNSVLTNMTLTYSKCAHHARSEHLVTRHPSQPPLRIQTPCTDTHTNSPKIKIRCLYYTV